MAGHKMTVVDGVRYRAEDAPEPVDETEEEAPKGAEATHKARRPGSRAKGGRSRDTATPDTAA